MLVLEFTPRQQAQMLQCFGEPFIKALPMRLHDYAEQWKLTDLHLIEYYSVNCLFLCRSEQYGDCVLKIFGCEPLWYIDEIRMLRALQGACGYVRAYEHDETGGALLLERIFPGTTLKLEPSLEQRLSVFIDIWKNAHVVPPNPSVFKPYLKTVEDAAEKQADCGRSPELQRAAMQMVSVCKDLYDRYPQRLLLHADLHGDNLLKDVDGHYRIVDPHARIGPPICDLGRYIANEYDAAGEENRTIVMDGIISRLSVALKLPKPDIARAFFVDITLMTCWDAEDGAFDLDGILYSEAYRKRI